HADPRDLPSFPTRRSSDLLAVDQDTGLLDAALVRPARDRVQHGVELLLRALLNAHLPALASEWDEIGPDEPDQVVDELLGGVRRRRLDTNCSDTYSPRPRGR